jgi:hypothetical protein
MVGLSLIGRDQAILGCMGFGDGRINTLPVASEVHDPINLTVEAQKEQFIIRACRAD